jgi:hypothetical protein
MLKYLWTLLLVGCASTTAVESPLVDSRLAGIVEGAVSKTGFNINISESTADSVNINTINGKNVCDPAALEDAKRLQDAIAEYPDVRNNFGPAYFSVTKPDGSRSVSTPEQMIAKGVIKGCTNIYVRVTPR